RRRIGGWLQATHAVAREELLLQLRERDRRRADHRDDAIDRLISGLTTERSGDARCPEQHRREYPPAQRTAHGLSVPSLIGGPPGAGAIIGGAPGAAPAAAPVESPPLRTTASATACCTPAGLTLAPVFSRRVQVSIPGSRRTCASPLTILSKNA